MKQTLEKSLSILLVLCMVLTFMPAITLAAEPLGFNARFGTDSIKDYAANNNGTYDYVYFGGLKWRVLDDNGNNGSYTVSRYNKATAYTDGTVYYTYDNTTFTEAEGVTSENFTGGVYYTAEAAISVNETVSYSDGSGSVDVSDALFLLSDSAFNVDQQYHATNVSKWSTSDIRKYLNGTETAYSSADYQLNSTTTAGSYTPQIYNFFTEYGFTEVEIAAILQTIKSAGYTSSSKFEPGTSQTNNNSITFAYYSGALDGDKVFLLSAEELMNSEWGMDNISSRIYYDVSSMTPAACGWWLRSSTSDTGTGRVHPSGSLSNGSASATGSGMRPALDLNKTSVLFASDAEGGKPDAVGNVLEPLATSDTNIWRLTLLDNIKQHVTVDQAKDNGDGTVMIHWSNAATGSGMWISAILVDTKGNDSDADDEIKGYIKLGSAATDADGNAAINLILGTNEELRVFSENCAASDTGTDYASTPQTVLPTAQYSVTYEANGGSGIMTDSSSPYDLGSIVTVLDNSFSRENYTFSGWNTAPDGSGTSYAAGVTFTISAHTKLYAQWTYSGDYSEYLVAYWPMDEGQGNTIIDESGNGNNGTIYGEAKWVDGRYGKALEFNGIDSYVNCGNGTNLNISDEITIEAWVNLYSWEGGGIVSKYSGNGGGYFLSPCWLLDGLLGRPCFFTRGFSDTGKVALSFASGSKLEPNEWHHLIATAKRGDKIKMYLDGICVAENIAKEPPFGNVIDDLLLGKYVRNDEDEFFNGIIDEVRIYNRALSDDDIENRGIELFSVEKWNQIKESIQSTLIQVDTLFEKNPTNGYLANIRNRAFSLIDRLDVFDGFSGYLKWEEVSELDNISQEANGLSKAIDAFTNDRIQGGDVYVFEKQPISNNRVKPGAIYISDETVKEVKLSASPGEYEAASLMIYAARDLDDLLLTATDLRDGNSIISSDNIDIGIVKWWYQSGDGSVMKSGKYFIPELILHDDSLVTVDETTGDNFVRLDYPEGGEYVNISGKGALPGIGVPPSLSEFPVKDESNLKPADISNGENKQYWLTVKVPEDAAPGKYKGEIVLTASGNAIESGTINIEVEVLPIELSEPYYTSSIYYRGYLDENGGTVSSEAKSRQQLEAELRNLYEHGVTNPICYQQFDISLLNEYLAIRQDIGMKGPLYYYGFTYDKNIYPLAFTTLPGSEDARQILVSRTGELLDLAETYGISEVYIYGIDEAKGSQLSDQRTCWEAIHNAGAKVFVAGVKGENISLMSDIQDLMIYNGALSKSEAEAWHNSGHKIWSYGNPQGGIEEPETYRKNYGLLLWQYDYDGACTYAYQNGCVKSLSWNDFDETGNASYRHHNMTYPTIDGVVDTIQWEGYREGVDDIRYLTTLLEAIESAKELGDMWLAGRVEDAEEYLADLKTTDLSTSNLDEIRSEIISHILKLNGTQYSVTYDANGGSGTMTDSSSPYDLGSTVTVLNNSFTKENYTFSGWNTDSDGTGTSYAVGATFTISANITLYAQWTYSGGSDSSGGSDGDDSGYTPTYSDTINSYTGVVSDYQVNNAIKGASSSKKVSIATSNESAEISTSSVAAMADKDYSLTVETNAGNATFTSGGLRELADSMNSGGKLKVEVAKNTETSNFTVSNDQSILTAVDISIHIGSKKITEGFGTLTITLPVGKSYAGQSITIQHYKDGKVVETLSGVVDSDGNVSFQVTSLSSFVVLLDTNYDYGAHKCANYTDINDANLSWALEGICYVIENGLFKGTSPATFEPNITMTRAMLVTVLYRMEGEPAVTGNSEFTDMTNASLYFYDAVLWATQNDIVIGYGNGLFGPNEDITRQQMVTILYRYAAYKGYDLRASDTLSAYTDADNVSDWALKAMKWAVSEGLISGTTATTLSPNISASRATLATILMRYCKNIVK